MRSGLVVLLALLGLAACARATLPYRPDPQPAGAQVSADYQVVGDRIRIEIDTDRQRLEQVWIITPDGGSVAPQAVELPPMQTGPASSVSIGIGGGTWIGRGSGVGTGISVGVPVGEGATRVAGNTIAWFPLTPAGSPPWRLYVKLAGITPVTFPVGGLPPP